ncbi:hypothetical protein G9A89_018268 [Geosiphon pyriformis]|nr:hypothetical protein G9A89_018268 [Geosiphon pyriformis]
MPRFPQEKRKRIYRLQEETYSICEIAAIEQWLILRQHELLNAKNYGVHLRTKNAESLRQKNIEISWLMTGDEYSGLTKETSTSCKMRMPKKD